MGSVLFGIILMLLYFLPSIVGYNKKNANSICVLNFFLGWTLVGWVVALIWAMAKDKENIVVVNEPKVKINVSQEIKELKHLLDYGLITQAEFDNQKKKLLNS